MALPADETERKFYKEFGPVFGGYFNTQAASILAKLRFVTELHWLWTFASLTSQIFNTADPDHIRTILTDLKTFPAITALRVNDNYLANSIVSAFSYLVWLWPSSKVTNYLNCSGFSKRQSLEDR